MDFSYYNFPSRNTRTYATTLQTPLDNRPPYDAPKAAYKEFACRGVHQLLSSANKDNYDEMTRWKMADAIAYYFECGDDISSHKPLDLAATLELAVRVKHLRLFKLAHDASIKRLQATASHVFQHLSYITLTGTAARSRSVQEWKDLCDAKTAAGIHLLDELEQQTAATRAILERGKTMRSDIY